MKTIYISIFFILITAFSLQAQFLSDESISPFADSYTALSQDFSSDDDLNFGMNLNHSPFSTFNFQFSQLSPSEDWLVNQFGASYAISKQGYLDTPYGLQENATKIPVGNGTIILTMVIGLYTIVIFIRKKLRNQRFALILP